MSMLQGFAGKKICVAVSGGVDSVSLLHWLKGQQMLYGYTLCAVHCEHGIRGEDSLRDARFVQELCETWGIPLYAFSENCPLRATRDKQSLETAARAFRIECFQSLLADGKADYIATAHHKNDDAETVLFRLLRGTSLTGVGGMASVNGQIIRPFLSWTRAEIETYAQENGLSFYVDCTNLETDATRNKLRLQAMPLLENCVAGATENLTRFAKLASEDDEFLYRLATELVTMDETGIAVKFSQEKPLFRRACLIALKALGVEKDYTALHLENAYGLQALQRGAKQTFPKGVEAERRENDVYFYRKQTEVFEEKSPAVLFTESGFDGGRYRVEVSKMPILPSNGWRVLRLDGDKIPSTAMYRFRADGDFIRRFGGGTKTLKKFFNEEKTPVAERGFLPLIAEENGEVYAVCGVEISDAVKVTNETKNILYITIKKS